jgi:nucleoside 2-deoxyribosyltransferase
VDGIFRVYLAGAITGMTFEECTKWRKYVEAQLVEVGIQALSPMRGKDFILKRMAAGEVLAQTYDAPMSVAKAIVARDRFDVMSADVVLFNFLGAEKVSIGTCVEVGWADAFRKLSVVVMEKPKEVTSGVNVHDHVFITETAGYRVETLDEAIAIIKILANRGVKP